MAFCSSCGQPVADSARFCSSCGAALEVGAASREARKVVSALFADLVGSTRIGERLDPEDFRTVVGGGVSRMVSAVKEYGGEVIQLAGDGFLALFGAPVAHEDDPERATLAGLRIVEEIEAYAPEVAREWAVEDFAVRVGIKTGRAVVEPVPGGGMIRYAAAGDVLNTAARLQSAADPGMVLVGEDTQRLIAPRFDWSEPRELVLKGKAAAVVAYPVTASREVVGARVSGVRRELVGRDEELTLGLRAVERAHEGRGGVLIVSGEAGVGKSRLVAELRTRFEASSRPAGEPRWLEGRCVSYGEALPYWPVRAVLRATSEVVAGTAAEGSMRSLEPLLRAEETDAGGAEMPPEMRQREIHDRAAELFRRLADPGPLAIFLDDVHWADTSTLALVGRLLDEVADAPILVVLATRPERERPFDDLRRRALEALPEYATEVALRPLPGGADRQLLAALVGASTLPGELEQRLLERAEGNPLYLEELVSSLVDTGALARADGVWRFDHEVPVEIPETVEKVILARIDRVPDRAQDLLGRAAVLGRQFPTPLLEAIAEDAIAEPLAELLRADLLRDTGDAATPTCAFKHTLIQEAAYGSLLKRRRQQLHLTAAAAIEDLYADRLGEVWGMLAHHTSAAGDDRRAIQYHRRAGEAARRLHALDEAIEHYGEVLACAQHLGLASDALEIRDATLQRGVLRFESGDAKAAHPDLEAAFDAARSASDTERQVEAMMALVNIFRSVDFGRASRLLDEAVEVSAGVEGAARVNALARLSIQYANQLRLDRALEVGDEALEDAERCGDDRAVAIALDPLKLVAQQLGDLERLERLTNRLTELCRAIGEGDFHLQWVLQWVRLESAFVPLGLARWDEAVDRIESTLEFVRRRRQRIDEPLFIDALGWAWRSRGDYAEALARGREASELAHELGAAEWAAWTDATLGWALLDARAPRAAVACLERGLAAAEGPAVTAPTVRCVALLGWAKSMLGQRAEADALAARADELLERVTAPQGQAWLFGAHAHLATARVHIAGGRPERAAELAGPIADAGARAGWREAQACGALVLGQARAALGETGTAERAFVGALDVADAAELPAPAWEARAALARLLDGEGRHEEAAEHAAGARAILERLALPLEDGEARAGLLAEAEALERATPPAPSAPRAHG